MTDGDSGAWTWTHRALPGYDEETSNEQLRAPCQSPVPVPVASRPRQSSPVLSDERIEPECEPRLACLGPRLLYRHARLADKFHKA